MVAGFYLMLLYVFVSLWLPFLGAAWLWHKWDTCQSRLWRTVAAVGFWVLLALVLGWLLQYFYVTHIWYSWESQHKFKMF